MVNQDIDCFTPLKECAGRTDAFATTGFGCGLCFCRTLADTAEAASDRSRKCGNTDTSHSLQHSLLREKSAPRRSDTGHRVF